MKLVLKTEETWIDNTKVVIKSLAFADTVRMAALNKDNKAHGRFHIYNKGDEIVLELSFD